MSHPKVTLQDPNDRRVSLLADSREAERIQGAWAAEDLKNLLLLCEELGIEPNQDLASMWFNLALCLAQKYHRTPTKRGPKIKWHPLVQGTLVVEIERIKDEKGLVASTEWASQRLSKREPWKSFVFERESENTTPDPAEIIRRQYFDARTKPWATACRQAFRFYQSNSDLKGWETLVSSLVRNPPVK